MKVWCDPEMSPVTRAMVTEPSVATLADAEVAFGQPNSAEVLASASLRWVHITSAGYTKFDYPEFWAGLRAKGIRFTNSSSVYADPCAQQVLAFMMAAARQLPSSLTASGRGSWEYDALRPVVRVLEDETVLLVGYGAIGARLAELLAPFRLHLVGLRRNPTGTEAVPTFGMHELSDRIAAADHIVNLLPASTSTHQLFDGHLFARAKAGAIFYNVGRGTTVDQTALIAALEAGRIAAAYLDVTDPEPLPADHPLWRAPNCYITPHIAGGRQYESETLARHFLANLNRYRTGVPVMDLVATAAR